jgi:hypothetical protein
MPIPLRSDFDAAAPLQFPQEPSISAATNALS